MHLRLMPVTLLKAMEVTDMDTLMITENLNMDMVMLMVRYTVTAPLIIAASNQKIFFGQLPAASIQERPPFKNIELKSIYLLIF